nr:hypothetical protein [Tanacetum cinerariifolium]
TNGGSTSTADASPTALSLDYVVESYPEKDEKDPKEDHADYPADRGDNDDDESSNDDNHDDDGSRESFKQAVGTGELTMGMGISTVSVFICSAGGLDVEAVGLLFPLPSGTSGLHPS